MEANKEHLSDLHDIKQIMERSSRFISLSGWSGISAGICALMGAFFAHEALKDNYYSRSTSQQADNNYFPFLLQQLLNERLFHIAILTFVTALVSSIFFTYLRGRKNKTTIWNSASRRLFFNVCIPLISGGIFLLKILENGNYSLIAPGCLLFYGLALLNGSKYTLGEVKYLAYTQIVLGLVCCWFVGWGLYFWAIGFGVMHIVYGTIMWYKYEKNA